jgi:RHS repeat-associated protein
MTKPNLALNTTTPDAASPTIHYELTNHLGNVMAVITDEPAATETPAVESLADYYPFGMTMPGRSYNAHTYRHGFTGHEKESDLAEGIYTTEYRLYDARVGRWLSVDPLFEKHVGMSPYNYCMLNPVMMVDPDGNFAWVPFLLKAASFFVIYTIVSDELETNETNSNTLKEIGYAMQNPIDAINVGIASGGNNISTISSNFEINVMKAACISRGREGDYGNAYRHVLWQGMITNQIGENDASRIGYAHESGAIPDLTQRKFSKLNEADKVIDLLNNEIGRKIGKENKGASNIEMAKLVAEEFYLNGLWTAKKVDDNYLIEKTKITKEQYEKFLNEINKKGENGIDK